MTEFLKTKEAITNWLYKHYVENYELIPNESYGHVVNVKGDVDLSEQNLSMIPVKFNHVDGTFYCHDNQLTSLEFGPIHVIGQFYCGYNQLTSLKFSPVYVDRRFSCHHNQLTSLEFCPIHVGGDFSCHHNQLTSLEFCPDHVGSGFYCGENPLLQDIQDITDFKEIYQHHQAIKIRLAKERLAQKLSDQPMISSQSHAKIKI